MARRWLLLLAIAALATAGLALSGCGKSEKDRYVEDYKPLNDRLLRLGVAIARAPPGTGGDGNAKRAALFKGYAADLDDVNKDIAALDTPNQFRADATALTGRIEAVVRDLRKLGDAARRGDRKGGAAARVALADDAKQVNQSQNRLALATGAEVGQR